MNPALVAELIAELEPEAQALVVALVNHFHKQPKTAIDYINAAQALLAARQALPTPQ